METIKGIFLGIGITILMTILSYIFFAEETFIQFIGDCIRGSLPTIFNIVVAGFVIGLLTYFNHCYRMDEEGLKGTLRMEFWGEYNNLSSALKHGLIEIDKLSKNLKAVGMLSMVKKRLISKRIRSSKLNNPHIKMTVYFKSD